MILDISTPPCQSKSEFEYYEANKEIDKVSVEKKVFDKDSDVFATFDCCGDHKLKMKS